ncbi:MAG: SDR family NAD(P)-dependent oxidoreductase [Thermoleophilaceae bacterium]|nr:SDR family NAD(P)-dependent oxidoreductase [Thermoleophilaceae bacterium]
MITGGNSGLGYECARTIATSPQEWHVVIASRNEHKAADAVQQLISASGNRGVAAMRLDLASPRISARRCASPGATSCR